MCLSPFRGRFWDRGNFRPGGVFHPAGGFEFNSKSIVFDPLLTVNFNPELSLFPYQAGVIDFPVVRSTICGFCLPSTSFALTATR